MVFSLALMLLVPAAQAQSQQVVQKLSRNQQMLRAYSWTERVEVLIGGQPVTRLVKVRYDRLASTHRTNEAAPGWAVTFSLKKVSSL